METTLWKIFDNVNSWLKYAENKNAYLLTIVGAQITIIKFLNSPLNGWLIACLIFLGLCLTLCVCSFFPKTVISSWLYYFAQSHVKPQDEDNLLFYGHIVKYPVSHYVEKMEQNLDAKICGNKYLEDLCAQIVANAGIASAKFNIFKICFWFVLLGQACLAISLVR